MRGVTKSVLPAALLVGTVLTTAVPVTGVAEDGPHGGHLVEQPIRGGPAENHSAVIDGSEAVDVDESATVDATVANHGGRTGTTNVTLFVDGSAVHDHAVSVPADATNTTSSRWSHRRS